MKVKIIFILFILAIVSTAVYAEETTETAALPAVEPVSIAEEVVVPLTIEEKLSKEISLDLRGIELAEVFKFLAKTGNLNIVTSEGVEGRVTLLLNDVAIRDVIDVILLTNKMAYYEENNIITILSETEYEELYGEKYNDKRKVESITLKYADATSVGTVLGDIASSIGKVIADSSTGNIILIDTPEKIDKMLATAEKLDISTVSRVIPTVTEVFELKHAKVDDVKTEITAALTENVGTIRSDTRTNKLVISDLPYNMEKIREMITAFDDMTKQVFIESKIIEVTLSDDYFMGVDWKALFDQIHDFTMDHNFPASSDIGSSKLEISFGTFTGSNYEVAIEFLKSIGDTTIISSPHIAVTDGQEAKFMVGSREVYVTTTTTTGEVSTTTSEAVEFVDVGVNVYVTPTISSSGYVKMQIKPEVSSVRTTFETTEGNEIPVIDTSNVETEIVVKDGTTIVMAGLIKETDERSRSKVPILGDIPIAGYLFSNTSIEKERKELVIFITPHIISGGEDYFYPPEGAKGRKPLKE